MSETMAMLAENSKVFMLICCIICCGLYLFISIKIMLACRKNEIDVCSSAMIPIYNLLLLLRVKLKKRKESKVYSDDEEITL